MYTEEQVREFKSKFAEYKTIEHEYLYHTESDEKAKELYNKATKIIDHIYERIIGEPKRYIFISVELSDPYWVEQGISIPDSNIGDVQEYIDKYDNASTSRWCNPSLLCVPENFYQILQQAFYNNDQSIYETGAVFAIACPSSGYSGLLWEWKMLNQKGRLNPQKLYDKLSSLIVML